MKPAMMRTALLALALLLPGCLRDTLDFAQYDITPAPVARPSAIIVLLEPFDSAPPYRGTELLYRLDYADGQLRPYANSAWRSSPDTLFARLLQQAGDGSLAMLEQSPQRARCTLRVGLAHFEQVFSNAKSSRAEVEVNFVLVQLRTRRELKRGSLRLQVPAATADAKGGAQAMQEASRQAADNILQQLSELLRAAGPARAACAP